MDPLGTISNKYHQSFNRRDEVRDEWILRLSLTFQFSFQGEIIFTYIDVFPRP